VGNETVSTPGTPLRNSLWNLLYRVVSSTDFSKIAWTTVLRGAALAFIREPIDELPLSDNDASRLAMKERFFALPEHRVYDFFEFLLSDDRAGLKELDRKLIRRGVNELLDREGAPVRLYRDRFRPFQGALEFDEMAAAEEAVTLFDLAAARRHLDAAYAYLSRRPEPEVRGALREAVLAVAAVALDVARRDAGEGDAPPRLAVGTVAHAAKAAGIPPGLLPGIEALLRRAHGLSGLPAGPEEGEPPGDPEPVDPREARLLVAFASSLVAYLLAGDTLPKCRW
jgi:hypothetical protein